MELTSHLGDVEVGPQWGSKSTMQYLGDAQGIDWVLLTILVAIPLPGHASFSEYIEAHIRHLVRGPAAVLVYLLEKSCALPLGNSKGG